MAVGPATGGVLKTAFKALTSIIPSILKKSGLPDDVAEAMGAKGNFWAGVTLGAGAALLGGGLLLGALAGGTLIAPGLLGSVLLNGAVATAAVAAGGFLLRETAKELGGSLIKKVIGAILGRGKKDDAENNVRTPAHALHHAPAAASFSVSPLKHKFSHAKTRTPVRGEKAFTYVSPRLGLNMQPA